VCPEHGIESSLTSAAEEGGGGKVILLNEGVYKGIDACAMAHPGGGYGPEPFDGECPIKGPAR
jgi:metal-dependent amidase/aminoacylase/carboxypeptidase family protein